MLGRSGLTWGRDGRTGLDGAEILTQFMRFSHVRPLRPNLSRREGHGVTDGSAVGCGERIWRMGLSASLEGEITWPITGGDARVTFQ